MEPTKRIEVQELIDACEKLTGQGVVLTVQECEAIVRCIRELEKKVLPDRHPV